MLALNQAGKEVQVVFVYVLIGSEAGVPTAVWTFVDRDDATHKFTELEATGKYDLILARTILGQMTSQQGLAEILKVENGHGDEPSRLVLAGGPARNAETLVKGKESPHRSDGK